MDEKNGVQNRKEKIEKKSLTERILEVAFYNAVVSYEMLSVALNEPVTILYRMMYELQAKGYLKHINLKGKKTKKGQKRNLNRKLYCITKAGIVKYVLMQGDYYLSSYAEMMYANELIDTSTKFYRDILNASLSSDTYGFMNDCENVVCSYNKLPYKSKILLLNDYKNNSLLKEFEAFKTKHSEELIIDFAKPTICNNILPETISKTPPAPSSSNHTPEETLPEGDTPAKPTTKQPAQPTQPTKRSTQDNTLGTEVAEAPAQPTTTKETVKQGDKEKVPLYETTTNQKQNNFRIPRSWRKKKIKNANIIEIFQLLDLYDELNKEDTKESGIVLNTLYISPESVLKGEQSPCTKKLIEILYDEIKNYKGKEESRVTEEKINTFIIKSKFNSNENNFINGLKYVKSKLVRLYIQSILKEIEHEDFSINIYYREKKVLSDKSFNVKHNERNYIEILKEIKKEDKNFDVTIYKPTIEEYIEIINKMEFESFDIYIQRNMFYADGLLRNELSKYLKDFLDKENCQKLNFTSRINPNEQIDMFKLKNKKYSDEIKFLNSEGNNDVTRLPITNFRILFWQMAVENDFKSPTLEYALSKVDASDKKTKRITDIYNQGYYYSKMFIRYLLKLTGNAKVLNENRGSQIKGCYYYQNTLYYVYNIGNLNNICSYSLTEKRRLEHIKNNVFKKMLGLPVKDEKCIVLYQPNNESQTLDKLYSDSKMFITTDNLEKIFDKSKQYIIPISEEGKIVLNKITQHWDELDTMFNKKVNKVKSGYYSGEVKFNKKGEVVFNALNCSARSSEDFTLLITDGELLATSKRIYCWPHQIPRLESIAKRYLDDDHLKKIKFVPLVLKTSSSNGSSEGNKSENSLDEQDNSVE